MISNKNPKVYQFKITLVYIVPTVWRRIQVPATYSFWDLHVAIQDAMGWFDAHLHEFQIVNPTTGESVHIGIPADDFEWSRSTLAGWECAIAEYFTMENRNARYLYDFGDDWEHQILLEEIRQINPEVEYPRCIGGAQACPPEDVGGPPGYMYFLEIMQDSTHPEYKDMVEWFGRVFDPTFFDPDKVWFDDPYARWLFRFGYGQVSEETG